MASIAIDGPAGAGKSTIARRIARELSYIYVDTGAMYRAMALYLLKNQIPVQDREQMEEACQNADISIVYENGEQQVILNGENVTDQLRTEEVGNMASVSSPNEKIREKLVQLQRKLAKTADVVMDGRDIGTKVLPDADLKIYLTASARVRALRRYGELSEKGIPCDLDEIEAIDEFAKNLGLLFQIRAAGGYGYTLKKMEHFKNLAKESLEIFGDSVARRKLTELVDYLWESTNVLRME